MNNDKRTLPLLLSVAWLVAIPIGVLVFGDWLIGIKAALTIMMSSAVFVSITGMAIKYLIGGNND